MFNLIPMLIQALSRLMTVATPALAIRLAALFGFGFVAYEGIGLGITSLENLMLANFGQLPNDLFQMLRILGVETGIKMLFAAYTTNLAIRTVTGVVTKVRFSDTGALS